MKIIRAQANQNNSYSAIQEGNFISCPKGYYEISQNLDTSIFQKYHGFVKLTINNNIVIDIEPNIEAFNAWNAENFTTLLQNAKKNQIKKMSDKCYSNIIAGIDVETDKGTEHFSLKETDQINLNNALTAIEQGIETYPYHADGKLYRVFTAQEIKKIVQAANWHKIYHTTLYNHLKEWINRLDVIEEIEVIEYSVENLPDDLALNFSTILAEI